MTARPARLTAALVAAGFLASLAACSPSAAEQPDDSTTDASAARG